MLSLFTLLFGFFPGYQHLWHCLWYLFRSFTLENDSLDVDCNVPGRVERSWSDLVTIPLTTMLLTVPNPSCGDFVFVPYVVWHVMGYCSPVWFSVFPGALFTMYLSQRPVGVLCSLGALVSREIRGDNRRLGTMMAAACHAVLAGIELTFFDSEFSVLSAVVVLCMAECKLRLRWEYELVPPFDSLVAAPAYVLNYFMWGWEHRWRYTDKVWWSVDFLYPVCNVAGAWAIRSYG